jgi:hypothetical protein
MMPEMLDLGVSVAQSVDRFRFQKLLASRKFLRILWPEDLRRNNDKIKNVLTSFRDRSVRSWIDAESGDEVQLGVTFFLGFKDV